MADDKVIDINTRQPHTAGPCICHACGHEWEGVIPVGAVVVECPKCKVGKGMRAGFVLPHADDCLHCDACGDNALWIILMIEGKIMCVNCGEYDDWPLFE